MSKKDKRILNQQGGRYPFNVSEEYFDNLTARIMEQIPEEASAKVVDINRKRRTFRWISIASIAATFALVVSVTLKLVPKSATPISQNGENVTNKEEQVAENNEDLYNEELMTYAMADGIAVYGYLSGYSIE